jgi:hypothetical protein
MSKAKKIIFAIVGVLLVCIAVFFIEGNMPPDKEKMRLEFGKEDLEKTIKSLKRRLTRPETLEIDRGYITRGKGEEYWSVCIRFYARNSAGNGWNGEAYSIAAGLAFFSEENEKEYEEICMSNDREIQPLIRDSEWIQ